MKVCIGNKEGKVTRAAEVWEVWSANTGDGCEAGRYIIRKEGGSRLRLKGVRKVIYRMTYDRQGLNRKALKLKRSFDEVKKTLDREGKQKK